MSDEPLEELKKIDARATAKEEKRAALAKYMLTLTQNIQNALPDGLVVIDDYGAIVLVNTQTENIFGYHRSEMLEKPVEFLVPERFVAAHMRHREKFAMDPHVRAAMNVTGRHKNGNDITVEVILSPLPPLPPGRFTIAIIRRGWGP